MRLRCVMVLFAAALGVSGCASVHNEPLNRASSNPFAGVMSRAAAAEASAKQKSESPDDAIIGLAFSGGGTRAAAFSHGVLQQLGRTPSKQKRDLLEHVAVVSGVSGGSVTAAYFGLKKRAAVADFRERFLVQDVMAELRTNIGPLTIGQALGGGVNKDDRLRNWFNANLFDNATYGDLIGRRPIVLINATDIYNRTPFLFAPPTFAAACSDITDYPVAAAVAASAAVPAAFAPVVIETFPGQCKTAMPDWVVHAAKNPDESPLLYSFAKALERARSGETKYIKLFDGGLVDNYGLSGITIARAAASTPYGPLRPEEAVNMRRFLFLVVDAGRAPQGDWTQTLEGPAGKDLVGAVVDAIVDANTRSSYAAFEATMKNWRNELVNWRCGLKRAEVARLRAGASGPWNCRDLKIIIGRVSFDQLSGERAKQLNEVPTSFTLPAKTVDEVVRAGGDALKANSAFQAFMKDL